MARLTCLNDCPDATFVACGGPLEKSEDNVYFYVEDNWEYTRQLSSDVDFELTEDDWLMLHEHAAGGCEVYCDCCGELAKVDRG